MKTVWAEDIRGTRQNRQRLSENVEMTVERGQRNIRCFSSIGSENKFYVSENSSLHKPKQIHEIDTVISETLNTMGLKNAENLPEIYVITDAEMMSSKAGSYNAVKNKLFLHEKLFESRQSMLDIQEGYACPESRISTTVHEMFHWKDAETYRKVSGNFSTKQEYEDYCEKLNNKAKKSLDKAGISEYNVGNISNYAHDKYVENDFDEVFTEYRTRQLLEKKK